MLETTAVFSQKPLESFGWYRPNETRESANSLLLQRYSSWLGAFVVRATSKGTGYVITTLQPSSTGSATSEPHVSHTRVYEEPVNNSGRVTLDAPSNGVSQRWHANLSSLIRKAQQGGCKKAFAHPLVDVFSMAEASV